MCACDAEVCKGWACGGGGRRCAAFEPDLVSSAVVCDGIDSVQTAGPEIGCAALTQHPPVDGAMGRSDTTITIVSE